MFSWARARSCVSIDFVKVVSRNASLESSVLKHLTERKKNLVGLEVLLTLKEQNTRYLCKPEKTKIHPFVVLGVGSYACLTNCMKNETMLNAYSLCRKYRCHDRIDQWSCRDSFALMNSTNRANAVQVMRTDAVWMSLPWLICCLLQSATFITATFNLEAHCHVKVSDRNISWSSDNSKAVVCVCVFFFFFFFAIAFPV